MLVYLTWPFLKERNLAQTLAYVSVLSGFLQK
jgi:hypothetical protein